eukprot:139368_1
MSFCTTGEYLERNDWKIDSLCEIYSRSKQKWCVGQVINIYQWNGEWLKIQYEGTTKEIQRYSYYIRPIKPTTQQLMLSHKIQSIAQNIKYLITGFCNQINYNLSIYDTPNDIINVILLYYDDDYKFNDFHTAMETLQFTNNYKTVKRIRNHTHSSICIFGEEISYTQFEIFNIEFKWKTCIDSFCMGYLIWNIQSLSNWNTHLGSDMHYGQVGIKVNVNQNKFLLYDHDFNGQLLPAYFVSCKGFKQLDIFTMSFNFKENMLSIYHNGIEAEILSLEGHKKLTPAFSLSKCIGEEIEIIKYYASS